MARGTRVQRKYKLPGGKSRKMLNVKIAAFFIMMLIFGVIALIIPCVQPNQWWKSGS